MSPNVSVGSSGFNISYDRLLSDIVPGGALLLVMARSLPNLCLGPSLSSPIELKGQGWGGALVLGVFLVITATALGMLANGLSWFTLGRVQIWLEQLLAKKAISSPSGMVAGLPGCTNCPVDDWYRTMGDLRSWLSVRHPELLDRVSYQVGALRMARSLSFVLIFHLGLRLPLLVLLAVQGGARSAGCLWIAGAEFLLAILLLALAAAMSLHYHLQLLGEARHLSRLGFPRKLRRFP